MEQLRERLVEVLRALKQGEKAMQALRVALDALDYAQENLPDEQRMVIQEYKAQIDNLF